MTNEELIMKQRKEHLLLNVPDVLDYKTCLYIGARPTGLFFLDDLKDYDLLIIEAFFENCNKLKDLGYNVLKADVRSFITPKKYDVIMWWHGIEHIMKGDANFIIWNLKKMTEKLLIIGCPYGISPQTAVYGNEYERHLSSWYPKDLKAYDFSVSTLGEKDRSPGHILSWWRNDEDSSCV